VVVSSRLKGADGRGPLTRPSQRQHRLCDQPLAALARGACELHGAHMVMREHFGMVVDAAQRLDPSSRSFVLSGASRARNLAVGDVTDEHVAEGILALSVDGRAPCPLDEFFALKRMQVVPRLVALNAVDCNDRPFPEDLAEDSCVLEQVLFSLRKAVQTSGD